MIRMRNIFVFGIAVLVALMVSSCDDDSGLIEQHKKLAGELRDTKLYAAAIEEYQKILAYDDVDISTRANVNYLIGKIYFENLADYRQAAAYYVRARALDPNGSFINEASKNLIAALERSGQVLDARRELGAVTDIDTTAHAAGDVVVAKIGEDPIWLSELEAEIQTLPADVQRDLAGAGEKADFLQQYIGMELMYRAAVRENYDNDPEILKEQQRFRKQLLINKYVLDKVMPEVRIDTMDVRNFYEARKGAEYNDAPYDSVKAQVFIDYQSQKAQQAFAEYIETLADKERVEVFDERIK